VMAAALAFVWLVGVFAVQVEQLGAPITAFRTGPVGRDFLGLGHQSQSPRPSWVDSTNSSPSGSICTGMVVPSTS
jgi:hypothetical protein